MNAVMLTTADQMLRSVNLKVTPQRTAVLRLLLESKEHPGVERIYNLVSREFPSISLATVYKTVELFTKKGLIQELNISPRYLTYDGNPRVHPHIYCRKCHRVEDIDDFDPAISEGWLRKAAKTTGYDITGVQLFLYGTCPGCRSKNKK